MTLNQFLKELSKTRGWGLVDYNIRCTNGYGKCCPITALANKKARYRKFSIDDYEKAGKYLRLNSIDVDRIVDAADTLLMPNTRNKLLKACKLQ